MFLLTAEEQEANDTAEVSAKGLLATDQQPTLQTITPDRAQLSLKDMLGYPQNCVASFISWLLDA